MKSVSVVVATRNRQRRLLRTLERLSALDEVFEIFVADNASTDGTASEVRRSFPHVRLVTLEQNVGAFARTLAARNVRTPYIAFSDDDTWWMPGSIARGVNVLDCHPRIALLNARVTVQSDFRTDEACVSMSNNARADDLPGVPILFFMAGAALVRSSAFIECGGYERRFFIGAEETLLALELHRHGWLARYLDDMHVQHAPSALERDDSRRRRLVLRNRLWVAWMRYTAPSAWRATLQAAACARHDRHARVALVGALAGLPWAMSRRMPVDKELQERIDAIWSVGAP